MLGGDIRILDAGSGEEAYHWRVPRIHAVTGGVLLDGTLLLECSTGRGEKASREAMAMDIATGEVLWRRGDVLSLARPGADRTAMTGRIPAIFVRENERPRDPARVCAAMIDVRTGATDGNVVEFGDHLGPDRRYEDTAVFGEPGRVIVRTDDGILTLGIEPRRESESATRGSQERG
jgi:hypothetical protein